MLTDPYGPFVETVAVVFSQLDVTYESGPYQMHAAKERARSEQLLERIDDGVRKLRITDRPDTFSRPAPPLPYYLVLRHCQKPTSLSLQLDRKSKENVPMSRITRDYANCLEALAILSQLPVYLATVPLRNEFPKLKSLRLSGERLESFVPVLKALGPQLEVLDLYAKNTAWMAIIDVVRSHCKNLHTIHLNGRIPEDEHVELLVSFAPQLRPATIRGMSEKARTRVVFACPGVIIALGRDTFSIDLTMFL